MSARLLPSRRAIRAQGRRASGIRAGCGARPISRTAEQGRRDIGRGSAIGSEDARRCIRFPVYCRPAPGWRNGRRGGLKNRYRKVCGFDSRSGHHLFDSPANSKAPPIAAPLAGIGSTRRKRAGSAFSTLRPTELAREGLAPTEGGCGDPAPGAIFSSPPREHEPPSRPLAGIAPMEPRHLPTAFATPAPPARSRLAFAQRACHGKHPSDKKKRPPRFRDGRLRIASLGR